MNAECFGSVGAPLLLAELIFATLAVLSGWWGLSSVRRWRRRLLDGFESHLSAWLSVPVFTCIILLMIGVVLVAQKAQKECEAFNLTRKEYRSETPPPYD